MEYRYKPEKYMDYLCDCLNRFPKAYEAEDTMLMKTLWRRMYFDTKQAVKEHGLSPIARDEMLDYYEELIIGA